MAGIGDNIRAETVSDRLELDYGELLNGSTDAIAAADELPQTVESSIDVAAVSKLLYVQPHHGRQTLSNGDSDEQA
jgi:hypothetical protein